ncbi:MAG: hypothetical protein OQK57_06165 [Ignavibacteriaceae bacterium]|nr:hypothetical protein [Ignavibacteriaceae bacterium]
MKSVFSNIINITLVASILLIIYLLFSNIGQNSKIILSEFTGTNNDNNAQKISIKQLDSLSASSNFHFSYLYAKDLLHGELR